MLILPGDPEFDRTLASPPPNWREVAARNSGEYAFVARSGSGLLEPVSFRELDDYLEGGEYAQRLQESDQTDCYWDAFGDEDEIEGYYADLEDTGDDYPSDV
ncbi:hypothetical protein [Egbenema bharatensis]|uniref:hypothetical protein n=1 Tax=Egbenema bharatensis TaxID=3463334 RepID=UPI003A879C76